MGMAHGGRLVAQALRHKGTTHLFTLCGGHIQAIYDGCLDEKIRVVDVRHEQTAGHAADGWARVTGQPGVCAVTAGPGVTDVVTAVANAQRAGVPMIVLGGAGPKQLADRGSLQDMDHLTLMRSITKWSVQVGETGRIPEYIDAAFRISQADVPGPVFLELPLDVLMNAGEEIDTGTAGALRSSSRPAGAPELVERTAAMLAKAERPVFLLGSQLRWSPRRDAVASLAAQVDAPFYLNGMARGALPAGHPNLMSRSRRFALAQADLVLVFGTPFDFRLDYGRAGTFHPEARVVQVDLGGAELGRNRPVDIALQADTGLVLDQLAAALGGGAAKAGSTAWLAAVRADENKKQAAIIAEMTKAGDPPNPLRVCDEIGKRLGPNDIVVGDGGDFVATAANVIKLQSPQIWMDPGPLGTLGVGPGYAMAAKLARPDARVVIVYGDGSFGLHALEFEAMARQGIAVVAVIGNDAGWTQIRRGQIEMFGAERAVATGLAYTRYERVVQAVGGDGAWVEKDAELGPALDRAFASSVPFCVNVKIAPSEFRKGAISV
jgi:acetolactate synthase-1/2/3 large subunit